MYRYHEMRAGWLAGWWGRKKITKSDLEAKNKNNVATDDDENDGIFVNWKKERDWISWIAFRRHRRHRHHHHHRVGMVKKKSKKLQQRRQACNQPASQAGRHHQLLSLQRNQIREQEQEERREPHERLCSLSLDCIRPNIIIIGLTFVKMRRRGDDDVEMRWDWNGSERNRDGIEQAVLCSLPPTWQLSYRLSERDTEQNQYLIEFELICL